VVRFDSDEGIAREDDFTTEQLGPKNSERARFCTVESDGSQTSNGHAARSYDLGVRSAGIDARGRPVADPLPVRVEANPGDDMLTGMAGSRDRSRVRAHVRWLLAGYAGLAGFFALEGLLRQPGSASSLEAGEGDRGTTRMIAVAYGLAADLPLLARWLPGRPLPPTVAPVGLVVEAAGFGVRAWSMRTLGSSYSRTLRTEDEEQALIDIGPYRLVRHPGYLGSLLTWAGFALTSRRVPVVGVILGLLGVAYGRRITAEEQLLRRDLPGYAAYSRQTKKLIPFIW